MTCISRFRARRALLFAFSVIFACADFLQGGPPGAALDVYGDPLPPGAAARLGSLRLGHTHSPEFAPDGKTIAAIGPDFWCLWDPTTGKELLRKQEPYIRRVLFTSDGKYIVTAANEAVKLWQPGSGKLLQTLDLRLKEFGPPEWITCAPNGVMLAICLPGGPVGGAVILWDIPNAREVRRLPKGSCWNAAIAFFADGDKIATADRDGVVRFWDVQTGRETGRLKTGEGPERPICFLAIPAPGDYLFLQAPGEFIYRYDLIRGGKPEPLKTPPWQAMLHCAPDGRTMAVARGGSIELRELPSWKLLDSRQYPFCGINRIRFSQDGRTLVGGCNDGGIRLWDVPTLAEKLAFPHCAGVRDMAFAESGRSLVLVSNTIQIWDVRKTAGPRQIAFSHGALSRDGMFAVRQRYTTDPNITEIEGINPFASEGSKFSVRIQNADPLAVPVVGTQGQVILPGALANSAAGSGKIHLIDPATGKAHTIAAHDRTIDRISVSPNGRAIASAGKRGGRYTLCVWEQGSAKLLRELDFTGGDETGYQQTMDALMFGPDGKSAFVHFARGTEVQQWDIPTGRMIRRFRETDGTVLAVGPDGAMLASASNTAPYPIEIFEVATGEKLGEFAGHDWPIKVLTFSPDGTILASAGSEETVLLWKMFPAPVGVPRPWNAADRSKLWDALLSPEGPVAYATLRRLIAQGDEGVAFLATKLQPQAPVARDRLNQWLRDLGDDEYLVREKACRELKQLQGEAAPSLRVLLNSNPTLEVRRRAEQLLGGLRPYVVNPEALRQQRAVLALEHIGTCRARLLLEDLGRGAHGLYLTEDSHSALKRLSQRANSD